MGGPLYFPEWLEGRRSQVICSTEGKGEREGWCLVEKGEKYWEHKYAHGWEDEDDW